MFWLGFTIDMFIVFYFDRHVSLLVIFVHISLFWSVRVSGFEFWHADWEKELQNQHLQLVADLYRTIQHDDRQRI